MASKFGEYRLKLYELFYKSPLCGGMITLPDGTRRIDVLILGSGWVGCEAFKAVLWAGQYPDCELHVTVASQNAEEFREAVYDVMPALEDLTEREHYAYLHFVPIADVTDRHQLEALAFEKTPYTYVIISLGDNELNYLVAEDVRNLLENGVQFGGSPAIYVFDENRKPPETGVEEGMIRFFGDSVSTVDKEDLRRIAMNINYVYSMKGNQYVSRRDVDADFLGELDQVFRKKSIRQNDCRSILGYFTGTKYNVDSSYASAVHIPAKYAFCGEHLAKNQSALSRFCEAVRSRDGLFEQLAALEHQRWMMFMAGWGFRAPRADETDYLYVGGNDHRLKIPKRGDTRLLHMCMFSCGERASYLAKNSRLWDRADDGDGTFGLWGNKPLPENGPSPLDRASLFCHGVAARRAQDVIADYKNSPWFQQLLALDHREAFRNLRYSIRKLFADEDNAIKLYETALGEAKKEAEADPGEDAAALLGEIRKALDVVVTRNRRVDFISLDVQMVEMIPFCTWYRDRYTTVVTFSNHQAYQDIITPTLLCAERAIFVGEETDDPVYQQSIRDYFTGRGNNTAVSFEKMAVHSLRSVTGAWGKLMKKEGFADGKRVIVNVVPGCKSEILMALGQIAGQIAGQNGIPVVQYVPGEGIHHYGGREHLFVGLDNKSLSVEEFIALAGGRYLNVYQTYYDRSEHESLAELFFETYVEVPKHRTDGKPDETFIPWILSTGRIQNCTKEVDCNLAGTPKDAPPRTYSGRFLMTVYDRCGIGDTLTSLQTYRVIRDLAVIRRRKYVSVTFTFVDPGLVKALAAFEAEACGEEAAVERLLLKRMRFQLESGLKISDLYVEMDLSEKDSAAVVEYRRRHLRSLEERGFIHSLQIEGETATFIFKNERTKNVLRDQGKVFELILYHKLKETNLNDVETGAKIAWNGEDISRERLLKERLDALPEEEFGYRVFKAEMTRIKGESNRGDHKNDPENEIDVIATSGMEVIFLSCKTNKKMSESKYWIYEVHSLAKHFGAYSVLSLSKNFDTKCHRQLVIRAKEMGVSLIGFETLRNPARMKAAVSDIVSGKTVSVLD